MKWPKIPFSKLAEIVTGNTPPKKNPENYGPGVPWVKPPDLDKWEPIIDTAETISPKGQKISRLLPEGTVMVSCIGSIGRVGIAGTKLATNQQINSLIFNSIIVPRFGYYYCKSMTKKFELLASKAVVPILNKTNFSKIKMPLLHTSEQYRIVEILDQADRLRKLRAEADAKAQHILPALFIKIFGDPAANPMGWDTVSFDKVVEIGTQLVDPNHPDFLDQPHIGGEHIEKETGRILSPLLVRDSNLRSNKFYFSPDHILLSKIRPYLNKVAYPGFSGVCSADIYPLRPKNNKISNWYLISLLRTQAFLDYAKIHSDRLRIPKLNKIQLGAFRFPLPDPQLIRNFDKKVKSIMLEEKFYFARQEKIEKLYQVLLHKAFTGDLTASWRETHMQELLQEMELQAKALTS